MQRWKIHWEFGPPEALYQGGICKRQIGTIKQAWRGFSKVLSKSPIDDEFLTCDKMVGHFILNVMNCRQDM